MLLRVTFGWRSSASASCRTDHLFLCGDEPRVAKELMVRYGTSAPREPPAYCRTGIVRE
jgi:hypothetical protein